MKRFVAFSLLILINLFAFGQKQRKLALVIGNANYHDPNGVLKNPINDSKLMSKTFKELEFDSVIIANDLSYLKMRDVFKDYLSSLNRFDVGFVYYSGHGIQDAYNETYLIPVDFPENSTIDDVSAYAYSIQDILKAVSRKENKLNIIILDACRNNPYEKGWKGKSLKSGGLSEPKVPPTGSLVAYSTGPGDIASDNVEAENSLYTKSLSEIMKEPNLKIEEIFKKVRNVVYNGSKQNQNPQWWGQLDGDLYLLLKKDYSKIEVLDLQKEAEIEREKGNIQKALDKYTILEIYLKSEMNNIDKKKLRQVYFDMGHIYYQMSDGENPLSETYKFYEKNKDNWTEENYREYERIHNKFLSNASNSFLNAKMLFENEGTNTNFDKELYSESFYKYLRCQSYLDYSSGGIDENTFLKEIDKLNKYNQDSFGSLNFRTACSYYLKALFIKEKDPLASYNYFIKSSEIFSDNQNKGIKLDDLNKYALTFNHVFPYKWSIMSFNEVMKKASDENGDVNEDKRKEINKLIKSKLDKSFEEIYAKNVEIINKGVSISKSNNNTDLEGLYYAATEFFHVFPIVVDVSNSLYLECCKATINYRNLALAQNEDPTYQDSITVLNDNAITYSNLRLILDKTQSDSIKHVDKIIYDIYKVALELAVKHNDGPATLWIGNRVLYNYYVDHSNTSLYRYDDMVNILKVINKYYPSIIKKYGCENECPLLTEYFELMDALIKENVLSNKDYDVEYKKQKEVFTIVFPETPVLKN